MRIIIDIGHPGHVHLFKHFAHKLIKNGHIIHFTVRDKEFEIALLKKEGFEYTNLGKHYKSKTGKVWSLFKCTVFLVFIALKRKPVVFLSHGSICTAWASFFLRVPNIALEDTGNSEQVNLYLPFTEAVLTSNVFHKDYGSKQIRYCGFHELAYLHPNYFKPDIKIRERLGLKSEEKLFVVRFISWNASHDNGQNGLNIFEKTELVKKLSDYGKVLISSEGELPTEFEKYRYPLDPYEMHNCLAQATLFVGEGATMASECAMIGTPAIYVNSMEAGSIDDQEKYGLVFHFRNGEGVIQKIMDLITDADLKNKISVAREKMLSDKIDVTAFLVWFVENWPASSKIMKENPDYQERFRS
jgi:predicted glycosyltransferase